MRRIIRQGYYLVQGYWRDDSTQLVQVGPINDFAADRWHFRAWRRGTSIGWGPWAAGYDSGSWTPEGWQRIKSDRLLNFYKAIL